MTLALANGFTNMGQSQNAEGAHVTFFGSKTVNNLPMMFELKTKSGSDPLTITYKVPVPAMQPLLDSCLRHIFGTRD